MDAMKAKSQSYAEVCVDGRLGKETREIVSEYKPVLLTKLKHISRSG